MDTLKQLLDKNYSNTKKDELIDLVTQIETLLGDDFDQILGITAEDIPKMTKKELIATINTVRENYDPEWEKKLASAKEDTLDVFQKVADLDNTFSIQEEAPADTASDANFVAQLGDIPFANLIGGPLNACVTAQNNASLATVNFIKEVGFEQDDKLSIDDKPVLRMTDFSYTKVSPDSDEDDDKAKETEKVNIKVPFISLLNIPTLRIENCTIDFHVKLNSVYTRKVNSQFGIKADYSRFGFGFGALTTLNVSAAYQRSTSTGVEVDKEYTMGVEVVATNDEMPAGLEKVLGMLTT